MNKQAYDLDAVKLPVQKVKDPESKNRQVEPAVGTNTYNQYH